MLVSFTNEMRIESFLIPLLISSTGIFLSDAGNIIVITEQEIYVLNLSLIKRILRK